MDDRHRARRVRRIGLVAVALAAVNGCGSRPAQAPASHRPSASAVVSTPSAPASPAPPPSVAVPAGVTAGFAVFDRQANSFVVQHDATRRFRSASLVKLLIVLDYLWSRGPGYAVPASDRGLLDIMLRSSDDAAASHFYQGNGREQIVKRMITRLGLSNTAAPPAGRGWGTAAFSAIDTVRIYRYLLDEAPAPVRDLVMGDLRQSTRCGTDHYDQSFGIPSAFARPWAVKQGWYGFGDVPAHPCLTNAAWPAGSSVALRAGRDAAPALAPDVDVPGAVLHTTGTVGTGDRFVIAVLTRYPVGTSFARAVGLLTDLTRRLPVPVRTSSTGSGT